MALERPAGAGPARPGWICVITLPSSGAALDLGGAVHLSLMLAAAMIPVTLPWLNHVALNSARRRRGRAMTLYLVAYLGSWLMVIAPAAVLLALVGPMVGGSRSLLPVALLIAAAWHGSSIRRRALADCVWTVSLAVSGRRADLSCLRLGASEAKRCVMTCWALMAVMLAAGTDLLFMASVTVISFASQWTTPGFAYRRPISAALALVGAMLLVATLA